MELCDIKGFGKARLEALEERGILTPLDLLKLEPSKYLDYSSIGEIDKKTDATQTVRARVLGGTRSAYFKGKSSVTTKMVEVNSVTPFTAVWFNQPFMKNNLHEDDEYFLTGKFNRAHQFAVQRMMSIEKVDTNLVPVYKKDATLSSAIIRDAIKQILETDENYSVLLESETETSLNEAFKELHFPTTIENLEEAKKRIAFEKLVLLASIQEKVEKTATKKNRTYLDDDLNDFMSACPFELTADQKTALDEIIKDMKSKKVMNRMLIGDVGSGKTVVALATAYLAIKSGYQAVILCPTEILAEQHYETAEKLFSKLSVKTCLLHSKLKKSEKDALIESLKSGECGLLVSTHSSLSDKVEFQDLALVITDEQHRFGVEQRAKIAQKSENPDSLVMSATPIPRSLSLVLFGGLEVSDIKSRPAGETKIKTKLVPKSKEKGMWEFIQTEIDNNNGKCFVIVPRIADTGDENIHSVEEVFNRLVEFGVNKNKIAIVHGKTESKETQKIINDFKSGDVKIVISTTIVEVGIDVKSANLMVIYNGERFGLASLHQLRGRIGRDGREGYCFVLTEKTTETSAKRLEIFKTCNNGLTLAEEDLKLRGAGTLYGTKQHGENEIFVNLNFSIDEYEKARVLIKSMDETRLDEIHAHAEREFGEIYKSVVLN